MRICPNNIVPCSAFCAFCEPRPAHQREDLIDALSIVLTNAAAACCRNPMGVDNIVLIR
jgi:hypothetical protein